jgi:hypothetical protein
LADLGFTGFLGIMVYTRFGDYGLYWNRGFGFVRMDSGRSRQIDR